MEEIKQYGLSGDAITLSSIEQIGFTQGNDYYFGGWSLLSTSNISVYSDSEVLQLSEDIVLYTVWNKKQFNVNFGSQNGSVIGANSGIYDKHSVLEISAVPNEDYIFTNWSDGNVLSSRQISVENDINLSANFALDTIIITYDDGNTPVEPSDKIIFTATNGKKSYFKNSYLPEQGKLAYVNSSRQVLSPFNSDTNVSSFNSVVKVQDNEGLISSIGDGAFEYCSNLSSIDCPNVSLIGIFAFSNCVSLTSIDCQNVSSIGDWTFFGCSSLISIDCQNVKTIRDSAFENCLSLSSIDCPNVSSIGNYTFCNCSNLQSINCPNVNQIVDFAFYNCSSLTSIDCSNVRDVGDYSFLFCENLSSVVISSATTPTTIYSESFGSKRSYPVSVYVATGMKSSFDSADVWKDINVETGTGIVQVVEVN